MLKIIPYPSEKAENCLNNLSRRGSEVDTAIESEVLKILDEVRTRGDAAVIEFSRKYDFPEASKDNLIVTEREFEKAQQDIDSSFTGILEKAISNIHRFHEKQLPKSWFLPGEDGTIVGQVVQPVESVGLYIPGGTGGNTPLISTLLMTAIPARVAGVSEIVLSTPPRRDGSIHPGLLIAARRVGVNRIYKMGSAWAIGAMAYGTETVKPVNVIAGPGNIYVTTAKKIVSGIVGIDVLAGPSEILVVADEFANPEYIAADLLSQAEHDPMASSILITTDSKIADRVNENLKIQSEKLSRAEIIHQSIKDYGFCFTVKNLNAAIELANRIAPEHMELHVKNPWALIGKIKNAGAIFIGEYTPEPVGDYFAGPNHVLPTSGTARYASALNVDVFLKKISILYYSQEALTNNIQHIAEMARWEGLDAHANSVLIRKPPAQ